MGRKRFGAVVLAWMLTLAMIIPQGTAVFAAEVPVDEESVATSGEMTVDEEDMAAVDEILADDAGSAPASEEDVVLVDGMPEDDADHEQLTERLPEDEGTGNILTYTDDPDRTMISNGEICVEGDGSVGQMLAEKLGGKLAEREQNNGCFIRSLSVSGTTATVGYEVVKDCTVVVGIYTENGKKLLGSGSAEISKIDKTVSVPITISNMPQYFYVKAFLVDTYEQKPLCKAYGSPEYTKDMQQLCKSTINDYDKSRVLNLDYSSTTNFLVYDAGVKQISEETAKNRIAKLGADRYRITSADSSVTGLKAGNIAAFRTISGEIIITRVKNISVSGTTVNITGESVKMEQAFDFVKIESTGGMDKATVDNSKLGPGVKVLKSGAKQANVSDTAEDETVLSEEETADLEEPLLSEGVIEDGEEGLRLSDKDELTFFDQINTEDGSGLPDGKTEDEGQEELALSDEIKEESEETVHLDGISEEGGETEYAEDEEEKPLPDEAGADGDMDAFDRNGLEVDVSKSISYSIDKKFGSDTANVTLSGVVDFATAVKAKVEVTPQNQYMEINIEYTTGLRLKASGNLRGAIPLGKFMVMPVPGVFIEFTPSLIAELSAAFEINGTLTSSIGIQADGINGISNMSSTPELTGEIKGEVTFFVGFSMEPEVSILCEQFIDAGLSAKIGVEANAVLTKNKEDDHLCGNQCVTGELYGKMSLGASISFLNKTRTIEYTMVDVKVKINDFYYSIRYKDFGWGKCPHRKEKKEYAEMAREKATSTNDFKFTSYPHYVPVGEFWHSHPVEGMVSKYYGNNSFVSIPAEYPFTCSDCTSYNVKVVRIHQYTFADSGNITSVYVPGSVNEIGSFAFMNCQKLTTVRLPNYLSYLGIGAFENCKKLKCVYVPSGITSLGNDDGYGVFSGCSSLKKVVLNGDLQAIGPYTFSNCTSLKNIDLPYSVCRIGQGAFNHCTALTNITLPARDVSMEGLTFYGDTALKSADISCQSEIPVRCFDGCKSLKNIKFSSKLTRIGRGAFNDCSSLNNIVLPESLRVIEDRAFWNCSKLKKIYIPKGIKKCEGHDSVFYGTGRILHIYFGGSKKQFESVMGKADTYRKKGIEVHFNAKPKDVSKSAGSETAVATDDTEGSAPDAEEWTDTDYAEGAFADSGEELADDVDGIVYDEEATVSDDADDASGSMSRKFTGLKKNTLYNVYYVKSSKAYDFFDADNLLYVNQYVSDNSGKLSISFTPRQKAKGAEYVIRSFESLKYEPGEPVKSIKLDRKEVYVKPGKTLQLKAIITPSNAVNNTVSWSTSRKSVATVSSSGKVTAKAAGTAVITAKTPNDKKATCKIKVPGIKLNGSVLYIQKGRTSTAIKATCTNDSIKSVKSSRKAVASVSKSGKKIKVRGKKPGKATITIKTKRGLKKKLTVKVQKGKVITKSLTVSEKKVTLYTAGKKKKATITVKATPDALSTGQKIKVSSSKKKIATASYNKKTGKLTITAKKKGRCMVTVSAGKKKKMINVTVK